MEDPKIMEFCNECGKSVKVGRGSFVNRIPDLNDKKTREKMGKPYPVGDFICYDCFNSLNLNVKN